MTAKLPSRERLKEIAIAYGSGHHTKVNVKDDEVLQIVEALLAAHEQEPVAYADPQAFDNFKSSGGNNAACTKEWMWRDNANGLIQLYTHPAPVTAVPDEISTTDAMRIMNGRVITMSVHTAYKNGWNACRAAMLNGGKS